MAGNRAFRFHQNAFGGMSELIRHDIEMTSLTPGPTKSHFPSNIIYIGKCTGGKPLGRGWGLGALGLSSFTPFAPKPLPIHTPLPLHP